MREGCEVRWEGEEWVVVCGGGRPGRQKVSIVCLAGRVGRYVDH